MPSGSIFIKMYHANKKDCELRNTCQICSFSKCIKYNFEYKSSLEKKPNQTNLLDFEMWKKWDFLAC